MGGGIVYSVSSLTSRKSSKEKVGNSIRNSKLSCST